MSLRARSLAYAAVFTALLAVSALLTRFIPVNVIPFSLQNLMVFMAGAVLDRRSAALSVVAYIMIGLVGIPVFAGPPYGGPGYVFIPSFGFLLGFAAAAWVIARILEETGNTMSGLAAAILAGIVVIYLIGLPYLYLILKFYLGKAVDIMYVLKIGLLPFIVIDLVKGTCAVLIGYQVRNRLAQGKTIA